VKISALFNRHARRGLLIEINPYQILAAGISRLDESPLLLDCAAEFDRDDNAGLHQWLGVNFEKQTTWVPVICGFVPPDGLLQRESIQARKLAEPGYLPNLVREQFKIEHPSNWKLETLSQLEGLPLLPEGNQRPALICGVSHRDVHQVQQHLLDHRLLPYRLEMSLLPLLGVIFDCKARRSDKRAVVVVNIEQEHTVAYILGKEGVHTSGAVRHGFASIVLAARKEFGLTDAAAVRERLNLADEELLLRATKFVRAIGRDLKPLVDSYEMTTGQPVGEIYCAYLPPALAWITEPLAQVVGRTPFTMDCTEWLPTVNLQTSPDLPAFGSHWLGALSLVADLPGPKLEKAPKEDAAHQGPWHIDCRLSAQLPSGDLVRRRFLSNVVAATLATCAVMFTFWQLYVGHTHSADIAFWKQRNADNQQQFDELKALTRSLGDQSTRLDSAYALVGTSYQLTDLVMNLGRSRPPNVQIDTIEGHADGLTIRGGLSEPSEQGSRTIRRYVEDLRRNPALSPHFASIALTNLDRQESTDTLTFEISFRLTPPPP
jgi:Tfp pilus assembly protein PilN